MKYKIARIDWLDSVKDSGEWTHVEDFPPLPPAECTSIGFVLEETKKHITIVQSVGNSRVLNAITIPRCAITKHELYDWT